MFTISWPNPTGAQRDWNYDTYAQAVIEAIDVISQVSGSPDVNIMGGCLGGMTAEYMIRLDLEDLEDLEDPGKLRPIAAAAGLTPGAFRDRNGYLAGG